MPEEEVTQGEQYRLRASSPMPVDTGVFKLHTFGAERNLIDIYECTTSLPASSEFRGQGLGGSFISASFSRLGVRSSDGVYFQGRVVHAPTYHDESILDGHSGCFDDGSV